MGRAIGDIHDHDMPLGEDAELFEIGRVWECDCGDQFYRTKFNEGTPAWSPVGDKKVIYDSTVGTTEEGSGVDDNGPDDEHNQEGSVAVV